MELVLDVDDLDAEYARVSTTGWPMAEDLTSQPWGMRDFRLLDPDGYYWRVTGTVAELEGRRPQLGGRLSRPSQRSCVS